MALYLACQPTHHVNAELVRSRRLGYLGCCKLSAFGTGGPGSVGPVPLPACMVHCMAPNIQECALLESLPYYPAGCLLNSDLFVAAGIPPPLFQ